MASNIFANIHTFEVSNPTQSDSARHKPTRQHPNIHTSHSKFRRRSPTSDTNPQSFDKISIVSAPEAQASMPNPVETRRKASANIHRHTSKSRTLRHRSTRLLPTTTKYPSFLSKPVALYGNGAEYPCTVLRAALSKTVEFDAVCTQNRISMSKNEEKRQNCAKKQISRTRL
jgi:hypothetical protein